MSYTCRIDALRVGEDNVTFKVLGLCAYTEIFNKVEWEKDKNAPPRVATSAVQAVTQQDILVVATVDEQCREFDSPWLNVANILKLGELMLDPLFQSDNERLELYARPLKPLQLPSYVLKFRQGVGLQANTFEGVTGKHTELSFLQGAAMRSNDQTFHRSRLNIQVLPGALEQFSL